jgi:RNA polymerase sigma-70 factor (ECF subfamily)
MVRCVDDVDRDHGDSSRSDDQHQVENVFDGIGDRLYGLALRMTGVKEEAEAAIDDALRVAARKAGSDPDDTVSESWLFMTVAHAAHQRLRARCHVQWITVDDVMPALNGDDRHFEPMDDWSDRVGEHGMQGALLAAMAALPPDYKTAFILHDVEGVSELDITKILDVDVPVVKSMVHHARLFVRKRLSAYFALHNAA